jgi:hypothetical protein
MLQLLSNNEDNKLHRHYDIILSDELHQLT